MKAKLQVRRCTAITRSGKPCQAAPVGGTNPPRCLMHQPGNAALMGSRGGHRRAIFDPAGLVVFDPPKTPSELLVLIATTIVEVREGRMDPRVANSISYLGTGFLNAVGVSDLAARVRALEERHERKQSRS
jgi:hypothetical protein